MSRSWFRFYHHKEEPYHKMSSNKCFMTENKAVFEPTLCFVPRATDLLVSLFWRLCDCVHLYDCLWNLKLYKGKTEIYFGLFEESLQEIAWPRGMKWIVHVCPNMVQKTQGGSSAAYCPLYCVILTEAKQILTLNLALFLWGHKSNCLWRSHENILCCRYY